MRGLTCTRSLSHICKLKPYKESKWYMPNGNPTGIYVYNCIVGDKVPVLTKEHLIATWYSCGPTVYDSAHIGHASCYVKLDIIQRILRSVFNMNLITAMGVTDIDDKIIKKAREMNTDFRVIAKKYEHEFWQDMDALNVDKPEIVTRVSENIGAIESFVKKLLDAKLAYKIDDGTVYFDTKKHENYGKLERMQESNEVKSKHKLNDMDFALWKGHKPGEPYFETSWGKGRPGWHIECSAMVSKIFGSQLDFHAGGIDLRFPHHENEEAQSCAYHNSNQWANYWLHVGHLHVKGDVKMSKSLKNTISIPDLLKESSADGFRMACLLSHYRYPMDYSSELLRTGESTVNKFKYFLKEAAIYANDFTKGNADYEETLMLKLQKARESVLEALKDDFDTSKSVNILLDLVTSSNKVMKFNVTHYPVPILLIAEYVKGMLCTLGLNFEGTNELETNESLVDMLVEFRHTVRMNALNTKNRELLLACDVVRDKLNTSNIKVNDSDKTASWVFAK